MFLPGAHIPRSQTAGIFELFLTPPVTPPPHTHKDGKHGESSRSPSDYTHPWTASCPLYPWPKACSGGCLPLVEQAEAAPTTARRGTAHLLLSSPSHRKEDTITTAMQTPGGAIPRGPGICCLPTPKLASPCSWVGWRGAGGTARGIYTADSSGSFRTLPSSQPWGCPISLTWLWDNTSSFKCGIVERGPDRV